VRLKCPDCGCVIDANDLDEPMFSRTLFDADELGLDPEEDKDRAYVPIPRGFGCEWTK